MSQTSLVLILFIVEKCYKPVFSVENKTLTTDRFSNLYAHFLVKQVPLPQHSFLFTLRLEYGLDYDQEKQK